MSSSRGEDHLVSVASEASSDLIYKDSSNKTPNCGNAVAASDTSCLSATGGSVTNNNTIDGKRDLSSVLNGDAEESNGLSGVLSSPSKMADESPPPSLNGGAATTSSSNVNSVSVCKEPERIVLTSEQLAALSKEALVSKWCHQDKYIASLLTKLDRTQAEVEELRNIRESEERLKVQVSELQRKEQYCIMRLGSKENELQELAAQVQELKTMTAGGAGLKHSLLDPAINLLFERLKRDLDTAKTKMEETQNELSAWKFTPDSNTGKQLMAKCRLLIKENEELGKMITSGRLAKLENDLALHKNLGEELKRSNSEMTEFVVELDEDMEGMQGTILYLQEQLRHSKEQVARLSQQNSAAQTPQDPNQDCPVKMEPETEMEDDSRVQVKEEQDEESRTLNGEGGLSNGRKRTKSDDNEVTCGHDDVAQADDTSDPCPLKRTRTGTGEGDGDGSGDVGLVENGV